MLMHTKDPMSCPRTETLPEHSWSHAIGQLFGMTSARASCAGTEDRNALLGMPGMATPGRSPGTR